MRASNSRRRGDVDASTNEGWDADKVAVPLT